MAGLEKQFHGPATDAARKLATEWRLSLRYIEGTGKNGQVLKIDVECTLDALEVQLRAQRDAYTWRRRQVGGKIESVTSNLEGQMTQYDTISEIVDPETGELHLPLEDWDIEVLERGLSENLGDLGGREPFVANARVRVTESSGESWVGLACLEG